MLLVRSPKFCRIASTVLSKTICPSSTGIPHFQARSLKLFGLQYKTTSLSTFKDVAKFSATTTASFHTMTSSRSHLLSRRVSSQQRKYHNKNQQLLKDSISSAMATAGDIYQTPYYHYSSFALVAAAVHVLIGPKILNVPMDLLMSALIPFHGHLGMRLVLIDYVPDASVHKVATIALWVVTVLAGIGLLKITFSGPGITESFRYLWKKPISHEDHPKKKA